MKPIAKFVYVNICLMYFPIQNCLTYILMLLDLQLSFYITIKLKIIIKLLYVLATLSHHEASVILVTMVTLYFQCN
jgi:hypothetical protein